jgi:membrane fusion protein (multidrug efflux system)
MEATPVQAPSGAPSVARQGAAPGAPGGGAAPVVGTRRPRKRLILAVVLVAAAGFGGRFASDWWTVGRFLETTDDAYVQAEITVLAAKVAGYLAPMAVDNNQRVAVGDVIARIEDGDFRLAVEAAAGKLATQRSALTRIDRQIDAGRAGVADCVAKQQSAQAEVVRAAADFERQQRLVQAEYASRSRFDDARAARDRGDAALHSAAAALEQQRANVAVLEAQRAEAERLADELAVQLRRAERDLSFTVLRAPFAGVIGNKAVETGAYVQPGQRLAALVPLATVRIDANFKETQIARMVPGQPVHVVVDGFPGRDFTGRLVSLAPASGSVFSLLPPENATGNFTKVVQRMPVRVAIPEAVAREGWLRPGLSVEVSVDTRAVAPE